MGIPAKIELEVALLEDCLVTERGEKDLKLKCRITQSHRLGNKHETSSEDLWTPAFASVAMHVLSAQPNTSVCTGIARPFYSSVL